MKSEHRTAISLNNTGVALLERGCIKQSFQTLADSVAVMTAAFQNGGQSMTTNYEAHQGMLHLAAQRQARLEPEPFVVRPYDIQVLSDYQSLDALSALFYAYVTAPPSLSYPLSSFYKDNINNNHAVLLRIEGLDNDSSIENGYELESAIILYNYGIAYRCMAYLTQDICSRYEINVGAMKLLHLSYSIVSANCESHAATDLEECELRRIVLLSTLVLQNLVLLSTELGLQEYGQEYHNRLGVLLQSAQQMVTDDRGRMNVAAAAAA